jgi:hypothetical protein
MAARRRSTVSETILQHEQASNNNNNININTNCCALPATSS